jgi:hypothetical protein
LLRAVQGAGVRLFTKKRMGIGVLCDVSIKDAWVSSDALMALGDQRFVLLRLPEQAVASNEAYYQSHLSRPTKICTSDRIGAFPVPGLGGSHAIVRLELEEQRLPAGARLLQGTSGKTRR